MAGWQVTEDAVAGFERLAQELMNIVETINSQVLTLCCELDENYDGLGAHASELGELIDELSEHGSQTNREINKLCLKLNRAALIRRKHIENNVYSTGNSPARETAAILGRIYDDKGRTRIKPHDTKASGEKVGEWRGNMFCPYDSVVLAKFNSNKKNFGEIRELLYEQYGISFTGIPYNDGYADFSSVAVARIDFADVIDKRVSEDRINNSDAHSNGIEFDRILRERTKNFICADSIAAEKQIPIPTLKAGYSKEDIQVWRKAHKFTWDESYDNGYILVPSVVHGNIGHTGLVGVGTFEISQGIGKTMTERSDSNDDSKCVREEEAIISIDELYDRQRGAEND